MFVNFFIRLYISWPSRCTFIKTIELEILLLWVLVYYFIYNRVNKPEIYNLVRKTLLSLLVYTFITKCTNIIFFKSTFWYLCQFKFIHITIMSIVIACRENTWKKKEMKENFNFSNFDKCIPLKIAVFTKGKSKMKPVFCEFFFFSFFFANNITLV